MKRFCLVIAALLALSLPLIAAPVEEGATDADRGIWLWGVPHGPFDEEMLAVSNEWASKKFGITFSRVDKLPPDMTSDQAIQLVIATDQFPDIM